MRTTTLLDGPRAGAWCAAEGVGRSGARAIAELIIEEPMR